MSGAGVGFFNTLSIIQIPRSWKLLLAKAIIYISFNLHNGHRYKRIIVQLLI